VRTAEERMRRRRGELNSFPLVLLRLVVSFLTIESMLRHLSSVCRDLYFVIRSNDLWKSLLLAKWGSEGLQEVLPRDDMAPHSMQFYQGYGRLHRNVKSRFTERTLMRTEQLYSRPLKCTVLGPPGIGKSHLIDSWSPSGAATGYACGVRMRRGLARQRVAVEVYDTSGDARYRVVRELCVIQSQVLLLCYDARSKVSMVSALSMLLEVEPKTRPGVTVVILGLNCADEGREVYARDVKNAHPTAVTLQIADHRDISRVFDSVLAACELRIQQTPNLPVPTDQPPLSPLDIFMIS